MARALKGQDPKAAKASKPKILISGKPGVGKTWTSIEFPSVYYIDTEGGANLSHYTDKLKAAGGAYFGPDQGSLDYPTVIEEVITLATVKHNYRTLVIDSFSKLFNTQIARTAEQMEAAGKKIEFGIEKKEAVKLTRRLVSWLDKIDMNVILICHEKPQWANGEQTGVTYDGWDKLEYELHLALQINKQGPRRVAKITKSRLEAFPDGSTFDWSFGEFAARYGKDVIEAAAAPVQVATDEQVQRLNTLIAALDVKADTLEAWKTKAEVETFAEMSRDTIQKCIAALESRLPKVA